MQEFRKKLVVVDAVQVDNANLGELLRLDRENENVHIYCHTIAGTNMVTNSVAYLEIETLEGMMRADLGDWIIRGVQGELYPCKPDVFAMTYEPVQQDVLIQHNVSATDVTARVLFGTCLICEKTLGYSPTTCAHTRSRMPVFGGL